MLKFPRVWRSGDAPARDTASASARADDQRAPQSPPWGGAQRPAARVIQMPQRSLTAPLPAEASRAFVRAVNGEPYRDAADRAVLQAWLATLPAVMRPTALAGIYPRIVKKIAHLWDDHDALLAYMDDLTIDRRGGRIGFPPKIADEIDRLHDFIRLCPRPRRSNAPD